MFCPKCGSETAGDVKFCRTCGTDLSLVSHALTGQLPVHLAQDPAGRESAQCLSKALTSSFTGLGFVAVALCVLMFAPAGHVWWFWMLIPAFALLGSGVAEYIRYRTMTQVGWRDGTQEAEERMRDERELVPGDFAGTLPPASVTENTTRHLDDRANRLKP